MLLYCGFHQKIEVEMMSLIDLLLNNRRLAMDILATLVKKSKKVLPG